MTGAVDRTHAYSGLKPLVSFAEAIAAADPDLIVPGDDLATRHLHDLYDRKRLLGKAGALICALIERSLGVPESFPVLGDRARFMELAQEEGIRVPETKYIENIDDLGKWVARMGLPTLLKANGTSGGQGVRIVHTLEEAESAFRALQAPPLFARAAKLALLDHDRTLVWPSLLRRRFALNAQAFVSGFELTSIVACWKGSILAGLHFEVLIKQQEELGPASVMRLIEHPEVSAACEKMVRRLDLSGLHGFDFMVDPYTGSAYLIELNPRATQVAHLTLGPGRDLPAALYAAVSGETIRESARLTENDTIALFPQEWIRNPASAFLKSAYHDVPWGEPKLIRACIRTRHGWTSWRSLKKVKLGRFSMKGRGDIGDVQRLPSDTGE
jgi:hypothetical protein